MTQTKELYLTDDNPTGYKKLTRLEFCRIALPILQAKAEMLKTSARIPDNRRDQRRHTDVKNAIRFMEDLKKGAGDAY